MNSPFLMIVVPYAHTFIKIFLENTAIWTLESCLKVKIEREYWKLWENKCIYVNNSLL